MSLEALSRATATPQVPVRVLIADADPLARRMLSHALSEGGISVVAETGSADEATELASEHQPDVVLLDAGLGAGESTETIRSLLARVPDARVLLLAGATDTELALNSLCAGASGCITREIDLIALPRVIQAVVAGQAAISRELTMELVLRLRDLPARELGTRPVKSRLTPREWEVLDLLCTEHSTAMIAHELCVTGETVRSHVKHILRKLAVSSRSEAVEAARSLRHSG